MMETAVYWVYDEEDALLYVGLSQDVRQRLQQHARAGAIWLSRAHTVSIEVFPNRATAEYFEAVAIYQDEPLYNIAQPGAVRSGEEWPRCLVGCSYRMSFSDFRAGLVEVQACAYGP